MDGKLTAILAADEIEAVQTALALRKMGSTEKTIIRAFAQDGKEALVRALFRLIDSQNPAPVSNASEATQGQGSTRRNRGADASESAS